MGAAHREGHGPAAMVVLAANMAGAGFVSLLGLYTRVIPAQIGGVLFIVVGVARADAVVARDAAKVAGVLAVGALLEDGAAAAAAIASRVMIETAMADAPVGEGVRFSLAGVEDIVRTTYAATNNILLQIVFL